MKRPLYVGLFYGCSLPECGDKNKAISRIIYFMGSDTASTLGQIIGPTGTSSWLSDTEHIILGNISDMRRQWRTVSRGDIVHHTQKQVFEMHILRCMGWKFCAMCPLKFHKEFWIHTPQNMHFSRSYWCDELWYLKLMKFQVLVRRAPSCHLCEYTIHTQSLTCSDLTAVYQ